MRVGRDRGALESSTWRSTVPLRATSSRAEHVAKWRPKAAGKGPRFLPILSSDPADAGLPGVAVDYSLEVAEAMGAMEDDSMIEEDVMDALDMPKEFHPPEWRPDRALRELTEADNVASKRKAI